MLKKYFKFFKKELYIWKNKKVIGLDEIDYIHVEKFVAELKLDNRYKGWRVKRLFGLGSEKI